MESVGMSAHRATLEDLPGLVALWESVGLPALELEKFLTEFQVLNVDGAVVAAVGLLIEREDGLVHSEALANLEDPDAARSVLWNRIQIVARNHGVHRLWTQEDAEFWRTEFTAPTPAESAALHTSFANPNASWLLRRIVEPVHGNPRVAEQIALWETARHQERGDFEQKVRAFRNFALILAASVVALMFFMVLYVFARRPDLLQRLIGGR